MSSIKLVFALLLLFISSGVFEAAMMETKYEKVFPIKHVDLPHCETHHDCAPLCATCGFCACLNGLCYRGCEKEEEHSAHDILGRKALP